MIKNGYPSLFLLNIFLSLHQDMINIHQIESIEKKVIENFEVTYDELMSYDKHKKISMARMMCVYILHKDYGVPTSLLSERYHRTRRIIFSMCQKMELIIKTYRKDREIYRDIQERLCNFLGS